MRVRNRSVAVALAVALAVAPVARIHAKDKHDEEHHVSTTEVAVAGLAIGALALLAAQGQKSDAAPAPASARRDTTTFYVHDSRGGVVPVYMTRLDNGGFIGPRGEYYDRTPSQDHLERTYGAYRPASDRERRAASDDKLKVDVGQGQVRLTRGGETVAVIRPAMAKVEKWRLVDDDKKIVVKSRGNHGPASVEMLTPARVPSKTRFSLLLSKMASPRGPRAWAIRLH